MLSLICFILLIALRISLLVWIPASKTKQWCGGIFSFIKNTFDTFCVDVNEFVSIATLRDSDSTVRLL